MVSCIPKLSLFLLVGVFCLLLAVPCFANGLEASGNVSDVDGVKAYTYTFTFDSPPINGASVTDIWVRMPTEGAKSVFSTTCSDTDWLVYSSICDSSWSDWGILGSHLTDGESLTLCLKTPSNVPTGIGGFLYYSNHSYLDGDDLLPVPGSVPEPSSLVALGMGLIPAGMVIRRRRGTNTKG